jgi:hypothetical protein
MMAGVWKVDHLGERSGGSFEALRVLGCTDTFNGLLFRMGRRKISGGGIGRRLANPGNRHSQGEQRRKRNGEQTKTTWLHTCLSFLVQ